MKNNNNNVIKWEEINWKSCNKHVSELQRRIYKESKSSIENKTYINK